MKERGGRDCVDDDVDVMGYGGFDGQGMALFSMSLCSVHVCSGVDESVFSKLIVVFSCSSSILTRPVCLQSHLSRTEHGLRMPARLEKAFIEETT